MFLFLFRKHSDITLPFPIHSHCGLNRSDARVVIKRIRVHKNDLHSQSIKFYGGEDPFVHQSTKGILRHATALAGFESKNSRRHNGHIACVSSHNRGATIHRVEEPGRSNIVVGVTSND